MTDKKDIDIVFEVTITHRRFLDVCVKVKLIKPEDYHSMVRAVYYGTGEKYRLLKLRKKIHRNGRLK